MTGDGYGHGSGYHPDEAEWIRREEQQMLNKRVAKQVTELLQNPGSALYALARRAERADHEAYAARQHVEALRAEVVALRRQLSEMDSRIRELLYALHRADGGNLDGRRTAEHHDNAQQYVSWRGGELFGLIKLLGRQATGVGQSEAWRAEAIRRLCRVLLNPDAGGTATDAGAVVTDLLGADAWQADARIGASLDRVVTLAAKINTAARVAGDHTWDWSGDDGERLNDRHETLPGSTGGRVGTVVTPAYTVHGRHFTTQQVYATP